MKIKLQILSLLLFFISSSAFALTDCLFANGFDNTFKDCRMIPPPGRVTNSSVTYGIYPQPSRPNMDITQWASVWGAASVTPPIAPWPGPNAASPVIWVNRTGYVAAKFTVPAGFPSTKFGQYVHAINPPGPPIDVSYSLYPGDFSATLGPGCVTINWPDDLSTGARWKINSANPSFCPLRPNTTYYMNIRFHDQNSTYHCSAGAQQCQVYLQHTHN